MIDLTSLIINLNDETSVDLLNEKISELKKSGYGRLMVNIKASPDEEVKIADIDIELFEKIKNMQELPDFVVINFLQAAGKLKETDFNKRFKNE